MKVEIKKLKDIRDYLHCTGFENAVDEINEYLQKNEYPESKENYEILKDAGIPDAQREALGDYLKTLQNNCKILNKIMGDTYND